jgi:pimeloyl-ACP methyl ester carboxylesterase
MKTLSHLLVAAALFTASSAVFAADKAPPQLPLPADAPTVVLVHGAFVDESSWNKLIPELNKRGIKAIAVANPLTSLQDDVDATRRVINAQTGPVVLVGHSWGGTVITEAGANTKVKALVYVAGYAPSAGESSRDDFKDLPASPGFENPDAVTGLDGYVTLARQTILADLAQDVPPKEAVRIAASQRPLRAANYDEDVGVAAWKSKPS